MPTLLAQLAPQRSTQYADLVNQLAPGELAVSPIGPLISELNPVTIGQQSYLKCELDQEISLEMLSELGRLATCTAFFDYFDQVESTAGPFLRPLTTAVANVLPHDMVTTRRYQGKTNELLTKFMCNLARFSSDFGTTPWSRCRLLDPLAGGGTTLFVALIRGASTAGIEQNKKSAQGTAAFLRNYLQEQRISFKLQEDRLKPLRANRWRFEIGSETPLRCFLARGEIEQTAALLDGFKRPHFIVADLPYGIQHKGGLEDLLTAALPIWTDLLLPGGTVVFSWESTRFDRLRMVELVEATSGLNVFNESPYNQMAHRVDRVIKRRDIIVGHKPTS